MGGRFLWKDVIMCNCDGNTCPRCDAGFKAFYNEQLENIKVWLKENNQMGASPNDYLDGRDVWYEYCTLCNESLLEEEEADRYNDQEYDPENACLGLWTEQDEMMRLNDVAAVARDEIA